MGDSDDFRVEALLSERQLSMDREELGELLDESQLLHRAGRRFDFGGLIGLFLKLVEQRGDQRLGHKLCCLETRG